MTRFLSAGAMIATAAACGSDSTTPELSVVGSYSAVQWLTAGGSGQTNPLSSGSTLQITLNSDGTTSGNMHVAGGNGAPGTDFDMAGTWTRSGTSVDFTQSADTFVRDMTFALQPYTISAWDLVGNQNFSGTQIQITLRRSP